MLAGELRHRHPPLVTSYNRKCIVVRYLFLWPDGRIYLFWFFQLSVSFPYLRLWANNLKNEISIRAQNTRTSMETTRVVDAAQTSYVTDKSSSAKKMLLVDEQRYCHLTSIIQNASVNAKRLKYEIIYSKVTFFLYRAKLWQLPAQSCLVLGLRGRCCRSSI